MSYDVEQRVLAPGDDSYRDSALKTWRYLRLAMIVVVVGLGVSILHERMETSPGCFQTSISAYYYTPVHGFFVGALVTIGACLICLKGNTEWEDALLNLAGMFSPVVALVPTPGTGSCGSVLGTNKDRNFNIDNNVVALLAVGAVALAVLIVLAVLDKSRQQRNPRPPETLGGAVAVAVLLIAGYFFHYHRVFFRDNAHYTAAILMFVCIWLVVLINGLAYRRKTGAGSRWNRYTYLGLAMVADAVIFGVAGLAGWDYWVLGIESTLITLFAIFWGLQTAELWNQGLRRDPAAADDASPA